jgi:flagellin
MNVDVKSGMFKEFTDRFNNIAVSSNNNYLKVKDNVPQVVYPKVGDELLTSQKSSENLKEEINKFQNLIKNINTNTGFNEIAKSVVATQKDLLNSIKENITKAGNASEIEKVVGDLVYKIDYLAKNTTFNNKNLLTGEFQNQKILNGMDANQFINVSIDSTKSEDLGKLKYETTKMINEGGTISIKIDNLDKSIELKDVVIGYNKGEGIGALANLINAQSNKININANYNVASTGFSAIESGKVENLKINDIAIGTINVEAKDTNQNLVKTINKFSETTGVNAFVDESGRLNLVSADGRGIKVEADSGLSSVTNIHDNQPYEVKFQANNNFINSTISSGFKINNTEINTNSASMDEFITLLNSKYDESGVKIEKID